MPKNIKIGEIGERIASDYLINKGYEVLVRNYRKKFGEIDIIAKSNDRTLVFVEVKTLFSAKHQKYQNQLNPEDNFTTQKSNKVNITCEYFAGKYPELVDDEKGWRVDLIAIEISDDENLEIRHYQNI